MQGIVNINDREYISMFYYRFKVDMKKMAKMAFFKAVKKGVAVICVKFE